jgi:hypothetical protein
MEVDLINRSDQSISCKVGTPKAEYKWIHTVVYGANKWVERRTLAAFGVG